MKISKYLETHGVGMPGRLVNILLIGIEKGIDVGDDMPGLLDNGTVGALECRLDVRDVEDSESPRDVLVRLLRPS